MNERRQALDKLSIGMVSVLLAIAIGEDDDRISEASATVAEYMVRDMDAETVEACKRRALRMVAAAERRSGAVH